MDRSGARIRLSASLQARKLGLREDWKLAGTGNDAVVSRTRFAGLGRPSLERRNNESFHDVSSEDDEEHEQEQEEQDEMVVSSGGEDESGSDADDESYVEFKKPDATRVILEVKSTLEAIDKFAVCPDCNGTMQASMETLCIATSLVISCNNNKCGYVFNSESPAVAGKCYAPGMSDNRRRSNDFAINVLFVVGFISCGDGGAEAARMLGLLGMPNDTTMETRSFQVIEKRISKKICKL
jgi:hypothetical protein